MVVDVVVMVVAVEVVVAVELVVGGKKRGKEEAIKREEGWKDGRKKKLTTTRYAHAGTVYLGCYHSEHPLHCEKTLPTLRLYLDTGGREDS
jgi:hypothetical protein